MFAKVFITLALVGVFCGTLNAQSAVPVEQKDCPQICPLLYAPVCGTDGDNFMEFSNSCEMNFKNCQMERAIIKPLVATDLDFCRTELVNTVDGLLMKLGVSLEMNKIECLKPCPRIYMPVCISNGKYRAKLSNQCLLGSINCVLGNAEKFRVLRNGSC